MVNKENGHFAPVGNPGTNEDADSVQFVMSDTSGNCISMKCVFGQQVHVNPWEPWVNTV